ncbi:MAG: hypothetical protein IJY65_05310 [Clostridia bacterium]|nr:hypothetical protein [Clostridia bacterium]
MEEQIRLSIPKIPAFDINYYYASDAEMYPPRIWPFHLHNELELYILFEPFSSHSFSKNNLIIPSEAAKAELLEIYASLRIASLEGDTHKQFGLILIILSIIRRFIVSDSPVQALPPMLSKILEDIDENFKSIRSLSYFTEKYYISQSTLNRLFRTHLRTTPKMYLETKRLANSRIASRQTSESLGAPRATKARDLL